ncbi:DHH family phosphoesterase [uncultured Selenomonas sp.]|uniref:DHH family phosphoesterase n=1 Tax=uncultured Selenomonas sp. TaxID=159275 RepID=UPI0025DE8028|nr:DHH family phosphoesterase [uncultured Selenomonas sp.]
MPRNLSAWIDLTLQLFVMLLLIAVLWYYNPFLAMTSFVVWICLAAFARERCRDRSVRFERYTKSVIANVNELMNYAMERLPQAIFVVDTEGRIQWASQQAESFLGHAPEHGADIKDDWPNVILEPVWGTEGEYVFAHEDHYFQVKYRPVKFAVHQPEYMVLFVEDVSHVEQLRSEYNASRTVLCYIQIDNYDEVMQGQTEAERAGLLLAVNQALASWLKNLGGFLKRVSEDLYVAVLDRKDLDRAMTEKFDVLDKVRQIQSTNRLPVTLSMGVAVAEDQTLAELGRQAQAGLDLALGRGGDQVAVWMSGKTQFFGGKAKAVEKHTRVKARVVAHAIEEIMESADAVYIMGHHNEDYDSFGAAVGIAEMARALEKPTHIILSDMNEGIAKIKEYLRTKEDYQDLLVHADDLTTLDALSPVLFVVDTHIPHLVADPSLLERVGRIVVIDHHRRSESFIKNPLLVYIEPASSSTSELVTELLMYFSDDMRVSRLAATALYSGIVVDTKNFAVQTGVRTFDAAAYLRRSGADPVVVRHLFRSDYDTTVALARAEARAQFFAGGLIVTSIPENIPNIQVIAAQTADSLLRIENVNMSIVVFALTEDTVGISARSTGEMNVQVIMEAFGGGGHQNVAGAQVKGSTVDAVLADAIEEAKTYIKEFDQDESDSAAGHQKTR